jgi:cell division protein FtsL
MLLGLLKEKFKSASLVTWSVILIVIIVAYRIWFLVRRETCTMNSPIFEIEKEKIKVEKELQARQEKILSQKRELEEIKKIPNADERRKQLADYANRRWK